MWNLFFPLKLPDAWGKKRSNKYKNNLFGFEVYLKRRRNTKILTHAIGTVLEKHVELSVLFSHLRASTISFLMQSRQSIVYVTVSGIGKIQIGVQMVSLLYKSFLLPCGLYPCLIKAALIFFHPQNFLLKYNFCNIIILSP